MYTGADGLVELAFTYDNLDTAKKQLAVFESQIATSLAEMQASEDL